MYVVRQFLTLSSCDRAKSKIIEEITPLFFLTSLINSAWILAWQYQIIWLSVFLIIGLLVSLILLTGRLSGGKYALVDYLSIRLPFSLYFGWLTVATIANVVVWLVSLNWNGFGISPEIWTSLILILGAAIGIMTALSRSDWSYLAVFIWA